MSVHSSGRVGRVARVLLPPMRTFSKLATEEARALPPHNKRSFKLSFLSAVFGLALFSIITIVGLTMEKYEILRYIGIIGNVCVLVLFIAWISCS